MRAVAEKLGCAHSSVQKLVEAEGVVRKKTEHVKANGKWSKPFVLTSKIKKKLVYLYTVKMWDINKIAKNKKWPEYKISEYLNRRNIIRSMSEAGSLSIRHRATLAMDRIINTQYCTKKEYRRLCLRLAHMVWFWHRDFVDPKRKKIVGGYYEIDHKISTDHGWKLGIGLGYINHHVNLRVVHRKVNRDKSNNSIITVRDLVLKAIKYDQKNGFSFHLQ